MKKYTFLSIIAFLIFLTGCNTTSDKHNPIKTDKNGFIILTDDQVDNIIKRAYQYVALYNVNNKFAITQGGWNTILADTKLKDHTMQDIARPNNDSFYTGIMLDLRNDAYVVTLPKFDSKYVSLMVTAYDHYVHVPKSTRQGDFQKDENILFYSARTENYHGDSVADIDNVFEANGDFISVIFRIMPHANEPDRFKKIIEQIGKVTIQSLSEHQGRDPIPNDEIAFPEVGKTDLDIFENNFLEVMQFILNHITIDENDNMDRALLASLAPLGIAPGETYNPKTNLKIDGKRFRERAEIIQKENLDKLSDPRMSADLGPRIFKPKGQTDLEAILTVSVIGPIGLPLEEAFYPAVNTADGSQMNAMNDYVIKMTKDELPPAKAFWSLTLYDKANGFFIPNEFKKYSVGENAGMKLNNDGGIEVYVSAERPQGVPAENWLPINRSDEDLDIILRIYVPELNKLSNWNVPVANKL